MINQPNAYWINFFIKRDCNVICWNYRGYGESDACWYEVLSPYMCKVDAEKVLNFAINKLQVKGPIGVYGRSIGGIAASHLAAKYPEIC